MLALPQIEEPEYDWTEADLNEAHQDALDQKAAQELDYLLIDAAIDDARWERLEL